MPRYVVTRLMETFNDKGKALKGSKVLVLGLAYKKDVDDMRESPSLELIDLLKHIGAKVDYNDPHIPVVPTTREHPQFAGMKSVPLTPANLKKYDAALISTDHSKYDYDEIVRHSKLVIDSRNACKSVKAGREKIVKA